MELEFLDVYYRFKMDFMHESSSNRNQIIPRANSVPKQQSIYDLLHHIKTNMEKFKTELSSKDYLIGDYIIKTRNLMVEIQQDKSQKTTERELMNDNASRVNNHLYKGIGCWGNAELLAERFVSNKNYINHDVKYDIERNSTKCYDNFAYGREVKDVGWKSATSFFPSGQWNCCHSSSNRRIMGRDEEKFTMELSVLKEKVEMTKKCYEKKIAKLKANSEEIQRQYEDKLTKVNNYIQQFIRPVNEFQRAVMNQDQRSIAILNNELYETKERLLISLNQIRLDINTSNSSQSINTVTGNHICLRETPRESKERIEQAKTANINNEKIKREYEIKCAEYKKSEQLLKRKIKEYERIIERNKYSVDKNLNVLTKHKIKTSIIKHGELLQRKLRSITTKVMDQLKSLDKTKSEMKRKVKRASIAPKSYRIINSEEEIRQCSEAVSKLKHDNNDKDMKSIVEENKKLQHKINEMQKTIDKHKENTNSSIKQESTLKVMLKKSQIQVNYLTKELENTTTRLVHSKNSLNYLKLFFDNQLQIYTENTLKKLKELNDKVDKETLFVKESLNKFLKQKSILKTYKFHVDKTKDTILNVIREATRIHNNKIKDAIQIQEYKFSLLGAAVIAFQERFIERNRKILKLNDTTKVLKNQLKELHSDTQNAIRKSNIQLLISAIANSKLEQDVSNLVRNIKGNITKNLNVYNEKFYLIENKINILKVLNSDMKYNKEKETLNNKVVIEKLRGDLNNAKMHNLVIKREEERANNIITRLKCSISKSKKEIIKLKEKLCDLKNELKQRTKLIDKNVIKKLKNRIKKIQDENLLLKDKSKNLVQELEQNKQNVIILRLSVKEKLLCMKNKLLDNTNNKMINNAISLLSSSLNKLYNKFIEVRNSQISKDTLIESLRISIEEVTRQITTLENKRSELLLQNNHLTNEFIEKNKQILLLKNSLDFSHNDSKVLRNTIQNIKSSLNSYFNNASNTLKEHLDGSINHMCIIQEKIIVSKQKQEVENKRLIEEIKEKELLISKQRDQLQKIEEGTLLIQEKVEKMNVENMELKEILAEKENQLTNLAKIVEGYNVIVSENAEKSKLINEYEAKLRNYKTRIENNKIALRNIKINTETINNKLNDFHNEITRKVTNVMFQIKEASTFFKVKLQTILKKIPKQNKMNEEKELFKKLEVILSQGILSYNKQLNKQIETFQEQISRMQRAVNNLFENKKHIEHIHKQNINAINEEYKTELTMKEQLIAEQFKEFLQKIHMLNISYNEFQTSITMKFADRINQLKSLEDMITMLTKQNNNKNARLYQLEIIESNKAIEEKDDQLNRFADKLANQKDLLITYKQSIRATALQFKKIIDEIKLSQKEMQNFIKSSHIRLHGLIGYTGMIETNSIISDDEIEIEPVVNSSDEELKVQPANSLEIISEKEELEMQLVDIINQQKEIAKLKAELDNTNVELNHNKELSEYYFNKLKEEKRDAEENEATLNYMINELQRENDELKQDLTSNKITSDSLKTTIIQALKILNENITKFIESIKNKLEYYIHLHELISINVRKLTVDTKINLKETHEDKVESEEELKLVHVEFSKELNENIQVDVTPSNTIYNEQTEFNTEVSNGQFYRSKSDEAISSNSLYGLPDESSYSDIKYCSSANLAQSQSQVISAKANVTMNHIKQLIFMCIATIPLK